MFYFRTFVLKKEIDIFIKKIVYNIMMKVVNKGKRNRVRIIIGKLETGNSSVTRPIKIIQVEDAKVGQVHKKILEALQND